MESSYCNSRNSSGIYLPEHFLNFETLPLTFSVPKTLTIGGKCVYINYENNSLIVQTPEMNAPNGLNADGRCKYSLGFSLNETSANYFKHFLEIIDKSIVEFFKNQQIFSNLSTYIPNVSNNLFHVNIPHENDKIACGVFNSQRKEITNPNLEQLITPDTQIQTLIQLIGVWIFEEKFGCSWKIIQMKLRKPRKLEYSFIDSGTENIENNETDDLYDFI